MSLTKHEQLDNSKLRLLKHESRKKWYVFYLCPHAEKVVFKDLKSRNYEVFLPLKNVSKVWNNRQTKTIEIPLFPSYIFVKAFDFELFKIKCYPRIANYVSCAGVPSIISEKDIECLKKMLVQGWEVFVESEILVGENVRIKNGPLAGLEGIVVEKKGKTRFGIQINDIVHTVLIDIHTSALETI